jgi:predicted PolB exonuclease-like 3'-5' exonuclease
MSKILLFDIETAPNISYTWGKWEQNVIQFQEEWYMLCFAYKWLDEKETHVVSLRQMPTYKTHPKDDYLLVGKLWDLFNQADVVIAHNGNSFDVKMAQSRFLIHKMKSPSPFKTVDTKVVAKRVGRFMSNSLDDLGQNLGLGRKIKHEGFDMWLGCMAGVRKHWLNMEKYNKQDVILLEKVYLALKGYMTNHPKDFNKPKGSSAPLCTVAGCKSSKTHWSGTLYAKNRKGRRFKCDGCGTWDHVWDKKE